MTRATEVCAVLFIVTSLSLGILSTQRGKSLMEKRSLVNSMKNVSATLPQQAQAVPAAAVVDTPQAVDAASDTVEAKAIAENAAKV